MPRRAAADEPLRAGTADMLMSRSSAVRKRLGNVDKVSIEYIEASGDCFYLAMEAALSEGEGWCPYYAVATNEKEQKSQSGASRSLRHHGGKKVHARKQFCHCFGDFGR